MRALQNIAICVAFCVGAVVLNSYPARAALIDQGVTTFDDSTNLEWLDLTETLGQSYDSVAAGFGGFTTSQGFDFATVSDVVTLYTNAGVPSLNAGFLPANLNGVQTLLELLGCTVGCLSSFPRGSGFADFDVFSPTEAAIPIFDLSGLAVVGDFSTATAGRAITASGAFGKFSFPVSSFLIREAVSPVPLPAALPLFGSALAMLGIVGWRRKRRPAA